MESLSELYRRFEACSSESERACLCIEQYSLLKGIGDPKILRRCLRATRRHASGGLAKVVLSAWLRFERREDELAGVSAMDCSGFPLECPKQALIDGFDPDLSPGLDRCQRCCNSCGPPEIPARTEKEPDFSSDRDSDDVVSFWVGGDEIKCVREKMASLSSPFRAMLCGGFKEAKTSSIEFSHGGVSAEGMRAVEEYSRTKRVERFGPRVVVEILSFATRFCCEDLKWQCQSHLTSLLATVDDALVLIEYGLEYSAELLVAASLQVILRELPGSLYRPRVIKFLCGSATRERISTAAGKSSSFLLYYFLSQVAAGESSAAKTTLKLLKRLRECSTEAWQIALSMHQLGCACLERREFMAAQRFFEGAFEAGHVYSAAGLARAKHKTGQHYSAHKLMCSVMAENGPPKGWMYQERSLYSATAREKASDLGSASEADPSLSYPFKCRAVLTGRAREAVAEIDRVVGFRLEPGCLELRAWFFIAERDYEKAARDVRVVLTLEPDYVMFGGKVRGDRVLEALSRRVPKMSQADCWMCLYDRWSCVDDIGSLAIIHLMLQTDPTNSLLRFRQSLLLLRLNCQKAAMRSLRLARNHAGSEQERLVYEGWILYDTGNREEALSRAEKSISLQRSFEAFFLKAYVLADTTLTPDTSPSVIHLLDEALRCPSDGLRKGQALNNLGSIYVDCGRLDRAAECYKNALDIKHTRAHQGLARVHHMRSQRKAAYDEMTSLIATAQHNASAYEKRSEYCDRDAAKRDLDTATELDPLRTYPYRYRAAVLMDDQREKEAVEELTKALSFKPDLQMLHLRAAFYDSIGDTSSAVRDCQAALCLDPDHSDTLDLYSRTHNASAQK